MVTRFVMCVMAGMTRFMAMGTGTFMVTRFVMCVVAGVSRFFMAMGSMMIWGS